jgi:HEAT repeat protein
LTTRSHQGQSVDYWRSAYSQTHSDSEKSKALFALRELAVDFPENTRPCAEFLLSTIGDFSDYVRSTSAICLSTVLAATRSPQRPGQVPYVRPADLDDLVARAVPALIRESNEESMEVRANSVYALRSLGVASPDVVQALLRHLEPDAHPHVRLHALAALSDLRATDAVPKLVKLLAKRNAGWESRIYAAEALVNIAPNQPEAVKAIRDASTEATRPPQFEKRMSAVLDKLKKHAGA